MRQVEVAEQDALLEVLERHREDLLALRGAHYADVGFRYVDGKPTDELGIRLHVEEKLPETELEAADIAPDEVEGIPVDVLQTNPELQVRNQRVDPVVGGSATTNSTRLAGFVGTLGAVVFDRGDGDAMCLSNHHVYVGANGAAGDNISQPTSTAASDQIATLVRWDQPLDCAVGRLNTSRTWSTGIIDYPSGVQVLMNPVLGNRVTKSGRTTDTTFGIVDGVSTTEFTIVPDPAMPAAGGEISSGGDSGSIWLRTDSPTAGLGLHFAGERDTAPEAERAWAKRLIPVVRALNVRFRQLPAGPVASGDTMQPGQVLNPGQWLTSADGRFRFVYQGDGNLVLYRNVDGKALWASNTAGTPAGLTIMQSDGNLVTYDPDVALWSSDTWRHPGSHLVVQNDGNVVIYNPAGAAVWSTNTWCPTGPSATGDDMVAGEVLQIDGSISSADGRFRLVYQRDGNLVLYRTVDGKALWASNTWGKPTGVAIMQGDGNLVIYSPGGKALWASNTWQHPGSRLVVQNDGNVVIYNTAGKAVWASNTWYPLGPPATGDDVLAGEVLSLGGSVSSGNGRFRFVYQSDGNLVLYRNIDGKALWASNTAGRPTGVTIMQPDGNLVIYSPGGGVVWASNTWQHPGSRLVVQNDGNVVVYNRTHTAVWSTNTWYPQGAQATGDDMVAGEVLEIGTSIVSGDGRYRLVYQGDGNLVLYRTSGGSALWASNTWGKPAGTTIMQGDGNLVIYGPGGRVVWASNTWQHPSSRLVVQNDGNAVIYRPDGRPVWASNTNESAADESRSDAAESAPQVTGTLTVPMQGGPVEVESGTEAAGYGTVLTDLPDLGAQQIRPDQNSGQPNHA